MSERKQLGTLLVEAGLLTEEGLSAALMEQGQTGKSLGRILIDMGLVTEADLVSTLAKQIGLDSDAENITAQASSEFEAEEDLSAVRDVVEDAPIVKLVNVLITQAVADRASDIHIEPTERDVRVRYRIDGVLHEVMRSPKNIQSGIISRLKIMADFNILNDESKNVITVEDPVEYRLPNINQVQVNQKAGLTFAAALRSILRSDPDIVLVGEIRDRETATIAIEAALTGHLVLSTLHTNDAASTPTRLVEMGVEPFLVSSALDCVVAHRLARKLCARW